MKAIILTADRNSARRVFTEEIRQRLDTDYDLFPTIVCKANLNRYAEQTQAADYIFSTWGIERFSEEEIKRYFPNAKAVFYAAGSVQHFASEFLACGVRVFSAWKANAIPVAEYTYAQILLATKGFFQAERKAKRNYYAASRYSDCCGGNYCAKIGIFGVGSIGKAVAQKLKANDLQVLYYDPYLPQEEARRLGITESAPERIFQECDVITNHLANKKELEHIFSDELFSLMKPYAVFINTGRGKQVDERALARAMRKVKTRTALLDVTAPEPVVPFGKLARCRNIIVTPHIAGSNGREVVRMAQYMLEEAARLSAGERTLFEVNADMLATMA